jgi:hypothetical protein
MAVVAMRKDEVLALTSVCFLRIETFQWLRREKYGNSPAEARR